MTAFPDPKVRLREVILRARGRTPSGEYTRIVDFPRILRDTQGNRGHLERQGFEGLPEKPSGAYLGIECQWHSSSGVSLPRQGEVINDPMLAYLVDLIRYGYEETKSTYVLPEGKEWNPPEPHFPEGFEAPEPNKTLKEAVRTVFTENSPGVKSQRIGWPTFGHGARGYRAGWGDNPHNAVLNTYLVAIQFGAGTMKSYDNIIPDFRPDDSEDRLQVVRAELGEEGLEAILDSGWEGRSGGRCITDYSRTVTFNRAPQDNELDLFREMLSLDKCPGWTGIGSRRLGGVQFSFSTTMDSSD